MAKAIYTAVVALLVSLCSSTSVLAQDQFPTSSVTPDGEWTEMHTDGYTGGRVEACGYLGLTNTECVRFQTMIATGECLTDVVVPNGTVFDAMTFTREGEHLIDRNVRVNLDDAELAEAGLNRESLVCYLGADESGATKVVGLMEGCDNYWVVNTWNPGPQLSITIRTPEAPEVRPTRNPFANAPTCPLDRNYRHLNAAMYEPAAAAHECAQQYMLPQDGRMQGEGGTWLTDNRFSRQCGPVMHQSEYQLGKVTHDVEVALVQGETEEIFFRGTLTGDVWASDGTDANLISSDGHAILIPNRYEEGIIVLYPIDPSKIRTPTASGIGEDLRKFARGCRVMRYTGIDL